MWVREPCSVWLLGGQGGHKGMLWGKELGRAAGFQEVGLFSAVSSDRATGTPALAPNKQILLVLLEEPSWVWGAIPERR